MRACVKVSAGRDKRDLSQRLPKGGLGKQQHVGTWKAIKPGKQQHGQLGKHQLGTHKPNTWAGGTGRWPLQFVYISGGRLWCPFRVAAGGRGW